MDLELADLNVLVSGASRGIGFAIAEAFAAEGARLALVARGAEALLRASNAVGSQHTPLTIVADMTAEDQIRASIETVEGKFGQLDIVVANIGSGASMAGYEVGRDEWERAMTLNFFGAATLASIVAPRLAKQGKGSLIFVSSIAGLETVGAPAPYAAAKAALQSLVKSYARLLGPNQVRVNAVAPGNVLFPGGVWDRKLQQDRPGVEEMLMREVPLQRFAEPKEIAEVVAFIASPRSSFVTGATIVVDGGQTRAN
jgi:3-oxoacyl-[acyl-carrier protein] reductase